jgi:hypothetical protein
MFIVSSQVQIWYCGRSFFSVKTVAFRNHNAMAGNVGNVEPALVFQLAGLVYSIRQSGANIFPV